MGALKHSLDGFGIYWFLLVILLMLCNWAVEAKKWQLLIRRLEHITFRRSYFAVLSGLALGITTPYRVGEYGGRILYVKNKNKVRAITVTLVGNCSQLLMTVCCGIIGLVYYIDTFDAANGNYFIQFFSSIYFLTGLIMLTAAGIFFYFRLNYVVRFLSKVSWLRKIKRVILVIGQFSKRELGYLLLLSLLRFIIFSAQYLILLRLFGAGIGWWQGLLMIWLIYLVLAIIPSIAIAELGIRGQVSLIFLGLLSINKIAIIAASLGIWFINLVVPAVIGSLLLLRVKVFQR